MLLYFGMEGHLWLFLLGTTMGKNSLLMTQVSSGIGLISIFFHYLEWMLLMLLCSHFAEALYRSDFFPGLGWMLTKSTWMELSPKWPKAYPYCCLKIFILLLRYVISWPCILSCSSLTRFYLLGWLGETKGGTWKPTIHSARSL